MKLIYTILFLILFSLTGLADCVSFYPSNTNPYQFYSTEHFDANIPASSYPDLGVGSRVTIKGYFSGLTATYFYVNQNPVYSNQGISVYVDCTQASLNIISNDTIEFVAPPSLSNGTHKVYVFKSGYSGYIYSVNKYFTRWSPALYFNPPEYYYSNNTISGLIFAINTQTQQVRYVSSIQPDVPIRTGVNSNEDIIIQIYNTSGCYLGSSGYIFTANFDSYSSPYTWLGDNTGVNFRGGSLLNVQIPTIPRTYGGYYTLSMNINGSSIPLNAVLYI